MSSDNTSSSAKLSYSYQQTWPMLLSMTLRAIILLVPVLVPIELFLFYGNRPASGLLLLVAVSIITFDVGIQAFLSFFVLADPWTLDIDRQTIRRSCHYFIRTKDWFMPTKGVSVTGYDLELPSCLFCWDAASMQAFHFVEMKQGKSRMLFPCADKDEQQSRVREIKVFLGSL